MQNVNQNLGLKYLKRLREMSNQNIYPKPCVYNCNTQIYWNTFKMNIGKFLPNKDIYVLIESTNHQVTGNNNTSTTSVSIYIKPKYYSKKSWNSNQPKPKMSNSFNSNRFN